MKIIKDLFFLHKSSQNIFITFGIFCTSFIVCINSSFAYPIYAQQAYNNPRAANGRIACANCHLAQKPVEIETPQSVLPNSVFEAIIKIPYDNKIKQILGNGKLGGLNVGAILILPDGFKLAPNNLVSKEIKDKSKGVYISPYSSSQENILVVGPIAGDTHQEIIFPILSPDPEKNKKVNFLKYPIYVGANRGRGQIYPTGEKSNNNIVLASSNGKILSQTITEKGETSLKIQSSDGKEIIQNIPRGLSIVVKENDFLQVDQPLTKEPNVGGFGQTETEIVLQSPARILGFMVFAFFILLTQIFLVLKKKQFEKVQAAELNF